ncbi:MAG: type II secretion system F family protein, partial [Planctomycetes bacterium]|nr:type II secretion system F family protein [Planctomycetota bacterium]
MSRTDRERIVVGVVASNARVGSRQKRDFLATLRLQLESGLPLVGSLHQQAEFSGDPACQACCAAMAQSIEAGNTLAEAAAGCRGLFTRFEVVAIAEGERVGELPSALRAIEDDLEWRGKLRSQAVAALIYPVMVLNVGYFSLNVPTLLAGHVFGYLIGGVLFNLALYSGWLLISRGHGLGSMRGVVDTIFLTLPPLRWTIGNAILWHQKALY